jgi:hypothetical protein
MTWPDKCNPETRWRAAEARAPACRSPRPPLRSAYATPAAANTTMLMRIVGAFRIRLPVAPPTPAARRLPERRAAAGAQSISSASACATFLDDQPVALLVPVMLTGIANVAP